jgi:hypothetical protein
MIIVFYSLSFNRVRASPSGSFYRFGFEELVSIPMHYGIFSKEWIFI